MTTIAAALERIYAIEAGLTISSPQTMSVKRVYDFFPSSSQVISDLPCFTNQLTVLPVDRTHMMRRREREYEVAIQFYAGISQPDDERNGQVALQFLNAAIEAFDADVSLAGQVTLSLLRGGTPTAPIILEQAGKAYIGFEAVLEIRSEEDFLWR
jgi:hypothetical protein